MVIGIMSESLPLMMFKEKQVGWLRKVRHSGLPEKIDAGYLSQSGCVKLGKRYDK